MLDESISYVRDFRSILSLLFQFFTENPVNNVDPDEMPYYVASDLGVTVCLRPFYEFQGKNGLNKTKKNVPLRLVPFSSRLLSELKYLNGNSTYHWQ